MLREHSNISIIYPTFNAEEIIDRNLKSILSLYGIENIELIIVDNNSTDSTREIISKYTRTNLRIISLNKNYGYASACNEAANRAKGEFLFFTNQDVLFPKNFFVKTLNVYELIKKKENGKDLILSPAVLFPNNSINYFGGIIHYTGLSYTPSMFEQIPSKKSTFKTLKASGCSLFIRKETFEKLGGFDSSFFMYKDDVDLSMRAYRNSIPIYTTNETYLYHLKPQFSLNDFMYYHLERNRFLLINKNISNLANILPQLLILEIGLTLQSLLINKFPIRLKIYKFLLQNYLNLKKIRMDEQSKDIPQFKKYMLTQKLSSKLIINMKQNRLTSFLIFLLNKIL